MRISDWSSDVCSSDLSDACREPAGGDDPELRGDASCALRTRRLRAGGAADTDARRLAESDVGGQYQDVDTREPRQADEGRSRQLEAGPDAAAARQGAARPRCRNQARKEERRGGKEGVGTGRARWGP